MLGDHASYWTGISQPANGTSRAPAETCLSYSGVRRRVCMLAMLTRLEALANGWPGTRRGRPAPPRAPDEEKPRRAGRGFLTGSFDSDSPDRPLRSTPRGHVVSIRSLRFPNRHIDSGPGPVAYHRQRQSAASTVDALLRGTREIQHRRQATQDFGYRCKSRRKQPIRAPRLSNETHEVSARHNPGVAALSGGFRRRRVTVEATRLRRRQRRAANRFGSSIREPPIPARPLRQLGRAGPVQHQESEP